MDHAHHHHEAGLMSATGAMGEDMSMPMYFMNTWHTTLWFKSWETKSVNAYVISLLGLVLLGIAHEAIACYRSCYLAAGPGGVLQEPLVGVENPRHFKPRSGLSEKLWATVLYVLNICSGYMLMLAVMTFNTGYFFAVMGGMGMGYFFLFEYNSRQSLSRSDNCHVRIDNHGRA